jgi:hypothetical protein
MTVPSMAQDPLDQNDHAANPTARDASSAAASPQSPRVNIYGDGDAATTSAIVAAPASTELTAPQSTQVRVDGDGQTTRIRPAEHGHDIWAVAQYLSPDPTRLGFVLASGTAVKVWFALLIHAVHQGHELAAATGEAEEIGLLATWDNGSLSKATNLKNTAVHAAQGELVALGWLTKRPTRNEQGQYGGFTYVLHRPPANLTDTAKRLYSKKVDALFTRAYEWQELLSGAEVASGGCFSHAELFAYAADKVDIGRKMVVDEHLRGCGLCRTTLAAVKASEREWGA